MVIFSAMGSPCRIIASDHALAARGEQIVRSLERRWSRFLPDTEIGSLNASAGSLSIVSPPTYELISCAEQARRATAGMFNPLVVDHADPLISDRFWRSCPDSRQGVVCGPVSDEPIELYPEICAVRLPERARFDPGGIGTGLAGDMVAAALLDAGSAAVQVELGRDVRVAGENWSGGVWNIVIDNSGHRAVRAATIALAAGGVATSSTRRWRWRRGGADIHHLVDAATVVSAATDLESVTAVAPTLWWAQVVSKVALERGATGARSVLEDFNLTGVVIHAAADQCRDIVTGSSVLT